MNRFYRYLFISLVPLTFSEALAAEKETAVKTVDGEAAPAGAWRATHAIGTSVKNDGGEDLGKIEDLIIDQSSGKVVAAIVSTGGFLGIADTLSSIPISAFKYDAQQKAFKVNLTKEQLTEGLNFKSSEWPDFNDSKVAAKLREGRDAIGGDVNAPDNTAKNERDAKEDTVTPIDQGNSESELKVTKDIRSSLVDHDLSFTAKNIKIITAGNKVTLRGVVKSKAEEELILKQAKLHGGGAEIDNQLEIAK